MGKIEVKDITKKFGNIVALNNVTLTFGENKIYGLLGRNGAGKSTLLNVIANRIFADNGEVTINGLKSGEADAALSNIFLMSENNFYPENMKVRDVFKWSKVFYPQFDMEYANKLAGKFGLNTSKKAKELSTGYTSIFKFIVALSVNVSFILLDEPVLGLDANHRDMFYRILIENYNEKPKTIVISTHLIEEAENVIEDIVIIRNGEILRNEPCQELLSKVYTVSGNANAVDKYVAGMKILGVNRLGGMKAAYVMGELDKKGVPEGIEVTKPNLQKLFIQLTNEQEVI